MNCSYQDIFNSVQAEDFSIGSVIFIFPVWSPVERSALAGQATSLRMVKSCLTACLTRRFRLTPRRREHNEYTTKRSGESTMQSSSFDAVERMLRGSSKGGSNAEVGSDKPPDNPPQPERPEPGSEEERAFLEAVWEQPEVRAALFEKYGEELKALGFKPDGTIPTNPKIPVRANPPLKSYGCLQFVAECWYVTSILVWQGQGSEKRGLAIVPEPGFVIKTKTLETSEKVFINMCRQVVNGFTKLATSYSFSKYPS